MQENTSESLSKKAKDLEKKYEWLQAAKVYSKAVDIEKAEPLNAAELQEKMGYCLFRAALQSTTNTQFKHRMSRAVQSNRTASKLFQKCEDEDYLAKVISCQAREKYAASWIETDPKIKRALLNEWWRLNLQALRLNEKTGNLLAVAKICNDLMEGSMDCKYWIAPNLEESRKIRDDIISLGERALKILSKMNDDYQLARTHCWLSAYYSTNNITGLMVEPEFLAKALPNLEKAFKYSKKIGDSWLLGWAHRSAYNVAVYKNDPSLKGIIGKIIECGEITRDNYLIGHGKLTFLSLSYLFSFRDEDPTKHQEAVKTTLELIPETIHHFKIVNTVVWNANFASCVALLDAASTALNVEDKKALLKKAVDFGKKSVQELKGFHQSNIPMMINTYCKALYRLSEIENSPIEKKQLIEDLMKNTVDSAEILQAFPINLLKR